MLMTGKLSASYLPPLSDLGVECWITVTEPKGTFKLRVYGSRICVVISRLTTNVALHSLIFYS